MNTSIDLFAHKTIRLAVSGDVALNRLETAIVDTADFQRLRQIKQLGPCYLVYPTALHTRFDHSLGTLSMAYRMLLHVQAEDGFVITGEHMLLARLFALLHDIFHVPFGHTLEDEFRIFPNHDENPQRIERFVGEDSPIGRRIIEAAGSELHDRLMRLFFHRDILPDDYFILDLVTNTICADLLDYLQRDAFFCNISMDSDYRFLRHLIVLRHEGRTRIAIRLWKEGKSTPRRDVLNELIRLLDNRYLLGERVYFHHAKLVAGTMIAGAVARAKEAGDLAETDLYELGDETLIRQLQKGKTPAAARLMDCLSHRTLWKRFYERGRGLVLAEQQSTRTLDVMQDLITRFHRDAPRRMRNEDRIAELLGMSPGDLLIYCADSGMAMKLADSMVWWNGQLRPLRDCSDDELVGAKLKSILESHKNLWAIRAFINPHHLNKADEAADAMDCLFTYDPSRKKRSMRSFYGAVLRDALREQPSLDAQRKDQLLEDGLSVLSAMDEEERTPEAIANWVQGGQK